MNTSAPFSARKRPASILHSKSGLEHAQELAGRLPLNALVEELSQGVHFEDVDTAEELTLVPSYWSTPFVFHTNPSEGKTQIVFGCRPRIPERGTRCRDTCPCSSMPSSPWLTQPACASCVIYRAATYPHRVITSAASTPANCAPSFTHASIWQGWWRSG